MLYLIATPIGNLGDISLRALETIRTCDYILCEDTRKTAILLNHYEIKKKLVSYHLFSESGKLDKILSDLKNGLSIALVSDGGSPALCDPGELLTAACIKEQITITSIPGPAAVIQALLLSGFPTTPFQFLGFVPKKTGEIKALLPSIFSYQGVSIFYESPKRLTETLSLLASFSPTSLVAIAREMTKTYEEVFRGTAKNALTHFTNIPPRGEIVLLIQGLGPSFLEADPKTLVEDLVDTYGLSMPQAIKTAAHLLEKPKQAVYQLYHS